MRLEEVTFGKVSCSPLMLFFIYIYLYVYVGLKVFKSQISFCVSEGFIYYTLFFAVVNVGEI